MKIDLLHNKIIAETATESFKSSLAAAVNSRLSAKYGDAAGVQMYEDYLSDGFLDGKTFYYPLSVKTGDEIFTEWVCWTMKKGAFNGDNPFAYIGSEPLEFTFCEAPSAIAARLGEARYFDEAAVKLRVETTAPDITILSGKYSQRFMDLMSLALGPIIERAASVSGVIGSSLELAVVFAPDTYMEHTSENVTYRRLLLVDKGAAPRDFWVKWTRLDGVGAYSIADDIDPENILFELGEDVPQKIKEKEYRFLTRAGKDKYHNAMGRKHVTEWRDVVKRAAKRGDLERIAPVVLKEEVAIKKETPAVVEKEERIPAMTTSGVFVGATVIGEDGFTPEGSDDELERAMEMARLALDSMKDEEENEEELDELEAFYSEDNSPETTRKTAPIDEDEERELDEITRMALESLALMREQEAAGVSSAQVVSEEDEQDEDELAALEALAAAKTEYDQSVITFEEESSGDGVVVVPEDPTEEEYIEGDDLDESDREELDDALRDVRALEPDEEDEVEYVSVEEEKLAPDMIVESKPAIATEADVARIREELEAKIRLEYESRAREKAEEEAARLRREQEQLRMENERLQQRALREQSERERAEENRRAETEQLRAQIEAQLRREAKEKERIAEAARIAVEEQQKLELEKLRAERMRLEEERLRREEEKRREEERLAEEQRLAEARRNEAERKAEVAEPEPAPVPEKNYTFISKTVSLLFRKSVDPNLITRIHATIKATLEYLGKQSVPMKIKATIPNSNMVKLEFTQFPEEEMELLGSIIKIMGNNNLGIAKAIIE